MFLFKDKKTLINWKLATICHPVFTELRNIWYPKKVKIVPELKLTPLIVAIWYCDDGHNSPGRRSAYFHTNGFSVSECEYLINRFELDLGVKSYLSFHRNKPQIGFFGNNYFKLFEIISPHITWSCMKYKIDTSLCPQYNPRKLKLTDAEILKIVGMYSSGASQKELAEQFKIKRGTISKIVLGQRRTSVLRDPVRKLLRSNNKSGVNGVCFDKESGKWLALIYIEGKQKKLGKFANIEGAKQARLLAEQKVKNG